MQQVTVGPEFEWACPICGSQCVDDIPLVVDKWVMEISNFHGPNLKKYFQITRDGEICDESESETESEDDTFDEAENEVDEEAPSMSMTDRYI